MPLHSSDMPGPGFVSKTDPSVNPVIEQATAAPGEKRDVEIPAAQRCWMVIDDDVRNRCKLILGHAGECSGE